MKIVSLFLILNLLTLGFDVLGQATVQGKWKTIDDKTGKTKSIIEIYEDDNMVFGRILKLFPEPGEDPDPVCDKCSPDDQRFNKKIIGMIILKNMKRNGDEYSNGSILDPEDGKVYKCKIWLESNDLKIRGYWGPFWRTQTWKWVS